MWVREYWTRKAQNMDNRSEHVTHVENVVRAYRQARTENRQYRDVLATLSPSTRKKFDDIHVEDDAIWKNGDESAHTLDSADYRYPSGDVVQNRPRDFLPTDTVFDHGAESFPEDEPDNGDDATIDRDVNGDHKPVKSTPEATEGPSDPVNTETPVQDRREGIDVTGSTVDADRNHVSNPFTSRQNGK